MRGGLRSDRPEWDDGLFLSGMNGISERGVGRPKKGGWDNKLHFYASHCCRTNCGLTKYMCIAVYKAALAL